mmetsp:Transcript_36116/g.84374  ORF Transcript_36116/g.84374 Transcript_36116/m.84374 type:complete len:1243 (-) Transcript_36116:126-3854(-)|eukprot:CAMPEP_0113309776 /NCGR_PEP_ID=MMETSP0010_2-20120614/7682_1 /TAXON_ID=216773 ORGANISM="Corethron hystrix, Strain 308" /NCGR_SAMPLE_ID=MMETSP0010_2 /ASSEMBLY_ACC=CAM_ASM_000155 /LENGTH=1242 /DNA_ID=CAMNT_0000165091 /DNA_START=218 /DNA_END=3946 /DNA_ORIENTATION=- /assembly_acc=CAM_ASM_000155
MFKAAAGFLLSCGALASVSDAFVAPSLGSHRSVGRAFYGRDGLGISTSFVDTASGATGGSDANEDASGVVMETLPPPPFKTIMAANRAEIAVRIMRAATELNMGTVAIYGHEDRYSQHRWGADRSFELTRSDPLSTPISAYLDIPQIIDIAISNDVEAIHPGYGFLSESPEFASACADAGLTFVGPTVENLLTFSDKTSAREAAIAAGVPVVPGSDGALETAEEVREFVNANGLPVILKAAMGGGGKGMRVIREDSEVERFFEEASSEALASFGDGSVFVESFVEDPRHIEVQIIGDGTGNVVHLYERDCSVQRRHQKVVEMAPAWSLPMDVREKLHKYAIDLTSRANYKNAGTVEFLVDKNNRPYFIEVNPRIQVEHTVTEEVMGIDLVKAQLRIAAGSTLAEVGLVQENIGKPRGVAIQCRVTTEDAEKNFAPDTGTISVYRHSAGCGIRMDGIGYSGMTITPFYDSMLVKYTARGSSFPEALVRMRRVLQECRIRGVKTNIPFLMNVLTHPVFEGGIVTTSFIDKHPELKEISSSIWDFASEEQRNQKLIGQDEKLLRYLANLSVNGHPVELGADLTKMCTNCRSAIQKPAIPPELLQRPKGGLRKILLERGPAGYAKYVRENKGLLLTDTTMRDAHQSLLATRMRTTDLLNAADLTNLALDNAFSLEMWGGATFDVCMRFLHECPWERLEKLREAVPDVPFQMLLRGANAVGYTNYPDNVVYKFCEQAVKSGIDIFRVFDSLNYVENLRLGVEAVLAAGGFAEGTMSYTGDVADPSKTKYDLDYYLDLSDQLVDMGVHSLAIKDMAGLLTPRACTLLVSALRERHPDMPIHVHTHDTAGSGVASMLAAANAGADIVDVAMDAMSGLTSQPSLGAIVANNRGTELDTGIDSAGLGPLNTYWENIRALYAPFESGQLSGSSDVYAHEIPGGQFTNLLYQSRQLGLTERWPEIKKKYAEANIALGDIPKVTPSSKVVGDLAQFMVAQNLSAEDLVEQASTLAFPDSVIQFLRGEIGIPPGGFPEPLRSRVLESRGLEPVDGRPGKYLESYNFEEAAADLRKNYGVDFSEKDILSDALYPKVFVDWKDFEAVYGSVTVLSTDVFLNPMDEGEEVEIEISKGRKLSVTLRSKGEVDEDGTRLVTFEINGERWFIRVTDQSQKTSASARPKAKEPGDVGSPMTGVIVNIKVKKGEKVQEGDTVATLSAMKMETNIPATATGTVKKITVTMGDNVEENDLIVKIV